jgi:hypothetical protein
MVRGKINRANSWLLINVLERLRNGEREALQPEHSRFHEVGTQ